jgi:hypothetical protein
MGATGAFSRYARPIHQPAKRESYVVQKPILLAVGYDGTCAEVLQNIAKYTYINREGIVENVSMSNFQWKN